MSEELSIWGNGTYWTSNSDENADGTDHFWKDADGYEIDLGLDWKLTDQVTYSLAAAFGEISLDSTTPMPQMVTARTVSSERITGSRSASRTCSL